MVPTNALICFILLKPDWLELSAADNSSWWRLSSLAESCGDGVELFSCKSGLGAHL